MSAPIPVFGDRPKAVPTPKLRALVSFPGNIVATTGISVEKVSGTYTFETNWNDFGSISAIPTAPTSYILTFDTATQAYVLVPSHLLGGAVAGIADAPNDGTQYGRQSGAWTAVTGGGFADAPSDGTQYGRQSGVWTAVSSSIPATVAPLVDGVAQVGTSLKYAREDHKHPSDTTRLTDAPSDGTIYGRKNAVWTAVPSGGSGSGDMLKSTYDPTAKNADAFDSNNEIFIQAGTGAVTRRSRDKMRDWVSVKDFGAIGDGITNDTNAINLALAAANSIYFPTGRYKTTSTLTVAAKSLKLFGAGQGHTQIWCAHAGDGINLFIDSASSANTMIEISDLDIVNVSGSTSSTAIGIFGSSGVQPVFSGEAQLLISNVRVYSSTYNAATEKWNFGIYLRNISNPRIINFCGWQLANHTGTAIAIANEAYNTGTFTSAYGLYIESPVINGWQTGIDIHGSLEGIDIHSPGILVNGNAINMDGTNGAFGYDNVVQITNGNLASTNGSPIFIKKTRNISITGVDIFRYGQDVAEGNVVEIQNGVCVQVHGNKIGSSANMPGTNLLSIADTQQITVTGNNFNGDTVTGAMGIVSCTGAMISGNVMKTASGPQAWYVVNSDKINFVGNIDIGFSTQSTQGGNSNYNDSVGNPHY